MACWSCFRWQVFFLPSSHVMILVVSLSKVLPQWNKIPQARFKKSVDLQNIFVPLQKNFANTAQVAQMCQWVGQQSRIAIARLWFLQPSSAGECQSAAWMVWWARNCWPPSGVQPATSQDRVPDSIFCFYKNLLFWRWLLFAVSLQVTAQYSDLYAWVTNTFSMPQGRWPAFVCQVSSQTLENIFLVWNNSTILPRKIEIVTTSK